MTSVTCADSDTITLQKWVLHYNVIHIISETIQSCLMLLDQILVMKEILSKIYIFLTLSAIFQYMRCNWKLCYFKHNNIYANCFTKNDIVRMITGLNIYFILNLENKMTMYACISKVAQNCFCERLYQHYQPIL